MAEREYRQAEQHQCGPNGYRAGREGNYLLARVWGSTEVCFNKGSEGFDRKAITTYMIVIPNSLAESGRESDLTMRRRWLHCHASELGFCAECGFLRSQTALVVQTSVRFLSRPPSRRGRMTRVEGLTDIRVF